MRNDIHIIYKTDRDEFINKFNSFLNTNSEGFLLVLSTLDKVSDEERLAEILAERLVECPEAVLVTPKRLFQFPDRISGVMFNLKVLHEVIDTEADDIISISSQAFSRKGADNITSGLSSFSSNFLKSSLTYNYEADFLLRLIRQKPFLIQQDTEYVSYEQGEPGDGNYMEFHGIYDKAWYMDNMTQFLIPMLKSYVEIPFLVQYYAMYNISCRLDANQNNNNRHVLSEEESEEYMGLIHDALQFIDDSIIMNAHRFPVYKRDYQFSRMLLRIKYNRKPGMVPDQEFLRLVPALIPNDPKRISANPYHHTQGIGTPQLYILSGNIPVYSSYSLRCNIQLLDLFDDSGRRIKSWDRDGRGATLEIDGSFPDIYDKNKVKYIFRYKGKSYEPEFCERFSITKYFGSSAYKRYPFHVSIKLDKKTNKRSYNKACSEREMDASVHGAEDVVSCYMVYTGNEYLIPMSFKSHTSRLAEFPHNSYWHMGDCLFTAYHEEHMSSYAYEPSNIVTGIRVDRFSWADMARLELGGDWELLKNPKLRMHHMRFLLLRMAWVATQPYFSRRRIWLCFDKIYKAGDSAEYMYKYISRALSENTSEAPENGLDKLIEKSGKKVSLNSEKNRDILNSKAVPDKIYYLVDKNCPDYKRLVSEGFRPLVRGSFLHRLVFLNADVMLVTNSTVFAFNDYYLENSQYIRGIPDFDVVCLQHGLSVQKIALAQQRLRDNTRLYMLASKYEQDNLSQPVYDYEGYDALKITGIPRYDGLIDNDKKQILISPTWRMQSAQFVTKNEGVERDYNPEFKETAYYKVYNSLINDRRLIEAAKEHGYRIKYVLHPIVSPQAKDFDENPYVDIIPSTGDMSYEQLFCESSLMITDYSGIQFDFAYMRKPVVYYHPLELEAHYEEGTYHYDTMAFGEIAKKKDELISLIIDYMNDGCRMKEFYKKRADDFFEYEDRENCRRVYETILEAYE